MKINNNVKLYKNKELYQEAYFEKISSYEQLIDIVKFDLKVYDCDYAIVVFNDKKEKILK